MVYDVVENCNGRWRSLSRVTSGYIELKVGFYCGICKTIVENDSGFPKLLFRAKCES